mgnify:CR=1 FL=1
MRKALAILCFVLLPAVALAQTAPKSTAKPTAKNSKRLAPSAQKAVEENTPIEDEPGFVLSPEDLAVAGQVYVGEIPCELGASVRISPLKHDGFFLVATKGYRYRMHPVESRTGAVRLEDPKRGAMWLQLGNKSMLMSQKLGQRLADDCMNPAQKAVTEALKANPAPSILDAPAPLLPPAAPAAK